MIGSASEPLMSVLWLATDCKRKQNVLRPNLFMGPLVTRTQTPSERFVEHETLHDFFFQFRHFKLITGIDLYIMFCNICQIFYQVILNGRLKQTIFIL